MDYSLYHPDWKDIIRPQILKRDGYKCLHCGARHKSRVYKDTTGKYIECDEFLEAWAISSGRKVFTLYLQVAHINHDKTNNEPENLMTLCPVHHARFDTEHKKFQRLAYRDKIKYTAQNIKGKPTEVRDKLIEIIRSTIHVHANTKISKDVAITVLDNIMSNIK